MKRATGLLLVVLALAGAFGWLGSRGDARSAAPPPTRPDPAAATSDGAGAVLVVPLDPAVPDPSGRKALEAPPASPGGPSADAWVVSGVVLDENDLPIADAVVFVGADKNPFRDEPGARTCQWDDHVGRKFPVDAEGRFRVLLPDPQAVFVCAGGARPTVAQDSELVSEQWVTPPREDLVLRLRRVPYATLRVRVHDGVAGEDLPSFGVVVTAERMQIGGKGKDGVVELVLTRVPASGRTFTVRLQSPETDAPVQETVHLVEGETREVVLCVYPEQVASGVVTNDRGEPIEGVLVYFGDLSVVKDDELVGAAHPERAQGVLTDARGWFRLTGSLPMVSFWHGRHQSLTLPAADGMLVTLGERGAIIVSVDGELDDDVVLLEEDDEPRTLPDGSFVFEDVDAGLHIVSIPGRGLVSVVLAGSETVSVGRERRIPHVALHLHASGRPLEEEFGGWLLGLRPVASCAFFTAIGKTVHLGELIPGEYLLMTFGGHSSAISIDGPELDVDVGEHRLTIRSASGGTFTLLTPTASALPAQARNGLSRGVTADGELQFGPLPAGSYVLRELGSGSEWAVEVDGSSVFDVP